MTGANAGAERAAHAPVLGCRTPVRSRRNHKMAAKLSASRGFGRSALPVLVAVLGLATVGCSGSDDQTDEHFSRVVYAVRQHTYFDGGQWQTDVAGGMGQ